MSGYQTVYVKGALEDNGLLVPVDDSVPIPTSDFFDCRQADDGVEVWSVRVSDELAADLASDIIAPPVELTRRLAQRSDGQDGTLVIQIAKKDAEEGDTVLQADISPTVWGS